MTFSFFFLVVSLSYKIKPHLSSKDEEDEVDDDNRSLDHNFVRSLKKKLTPKIPTNLIP